MERGILLRFLLFLLLTVLCPPLFSLPLEDESFAEHGEKVDHFIARTVSRIGEAWNLSIFEFKLAFRYLSEAPAKAAEQEIKARTDAIIEDIGNRAAETVTEKLQTVRDDACEGAKNAAKKAVDDASDAAEGEKAP